MSKRRLAQLRTRLKRAGIKYQDVAREALVTPSFVSHVFAGRFKSQNVIGTAERLAAERLNEAEPEKMEATA